MSTRAITGNAVDEVGARVRWREGDADVLAAARAGDVGVFETLYRANVAWVYGLCLRMLADRARAEEATQDTFVRAWQRLASFRGGSSFATWLHRVAVNTAVSVVRGERRQVRDDADLEDLEMAAQVAPSAARIELERAIALLPAGARSVLVRLDVEGLGHEEIADLLGCAVGTFQAQRHGGRRLLRTVLQ